MAPPGQRRVAGRQQTTPDLIADVLLFALRAGRRTPWSGV
jgi:hypothetical protein